MTSFVIRAITEKPIIVIENGNEILAELKRQGNNLNQVVRNNYNGLATAEELRKQDYVNMKDEANRLGKKFGFSETDFRKRGKNSRTAVEKKIMLKGGISWKEELREVIAEATKKSRTLDKFKEYLEKCYGVKITRDGKDFSYLHPEKQKPIRGEKLGTNYKKMEVLRVMKQSINKMADNAVVAVNESAGKMINEVNKAKKEIEKAKDEIRFESGFRRFMFWLSPVLAVAQTALLIMLAL